MKTITIFFLITILISFSNNSRGQICQNASDTIYGLNSITGSGSGQVYGISVSTGGTNAIGSPPSGSANANGMGFSSSDGKFYFFNWVGGGAGTTEFISFDPVTGTKTPLAIPSSPALPTSSSGKIRSGAVSDNGVDYYTIFPGATTAMGYPITGPAFYYYNIAANTWTLITQSFKDISGNNVAELKNLNSGDMAFDGLGRLWILCSKSTSYALYRVNAPIPTSPVASIVVDTIIPATPTPGGVSFTGIGFNSVGFMYLSTGSGVGVGNNVLYQMTSPTAPLVTIGTLPNGSGDDITSCVTPVAVLPFSYFQFNAKLNGDFVKLLWKTDEPPNLTGYNVEFSTDGMRWKQIGYVDKNSSNTEGAKTFSHFTYSNGNNYYRIVQLITGSSAKYSTVQRVIVNGDSKKISVSPNPARDLIRLHGNDGNIISGPVKIFDYSGRVVYSGYLDQNTQAIDIHELVKGYYLLKLQAVAGKESPASIRFIKQ